MSSGYVTLSAFLRNDTAPAFNFLFRIIGPVVFVILAASCLYSVGLDIYVTKIWLVIVYYYAGRLIYVLGFNRFRLVNWWREAFLWIASIGLGWLIYDQVIQVRENLLPDTKDLKNQFWILLILFVYSTFNSIRFSQAGTKKRKTNYLRDSYCHNKAVHGETISALATDMLSESIIYAVLLFEQFNRPPMVRLVERMVFPWGSKSLGPMQIKSARRITDNESVRLGVLHVMEIYQSAIETGIQKAATKDKLFDPITNYSHRQFVVYKVASAYNKDDSYLAGIQEMHLQVIEEQYPNLVFKYPHWSDTLV